MYDYLIVGAGLAGCTLAERLASVAGKKVLLVERRNHIGGNAFDYFDEHGVLVHKYGPHYFRTNRDHVREYLSQFTEWHPVDYEIRVYVDGQFYNFPINLNTYNALYGTDLTSEDLAKIFVEPERPSGEYANSEEAIVAKVGWDLYEKFFKNYTKKQWGVWPSELDASVCGRIPIRTNRDNRYFSDRFQAMPKHGYFRMFERMLEHPNIHLMLQTDYATVKGLIPHRNVIYTGCIDEFFCWKYGKLPCRSLRFEFEHVEREFFQPVSQVNYPNDYEFTRIVEIKHVTGQKHHATTIVREYPCTKGEPYYPIPRQENRQLYQRYLAEATESGVDFIGRLAEYQYLNMDEVVAKALDLFSTGSATGKWDAG